MDHSFARSVIAVPFNLSPSREHFDLGNGRRFFSSALWVAYELLTKCFPSACRMWDTFLLEVLASRELCERRKKGSQIQHF